MLIPDYQRGGVDLYCGDCLEILPQLPEAFVQCVVTSPPYWGLRDYGVAGQLGVESTPEEYVAKLVAMFREVRRVLRDDGTVWLNLGDSYASSPPGCQNGGVSESSTLHGVRGVSGTYRETLRQSVGQKRNTVVGRLKPKDLVGIPWRVAFALQADGWWLRQDIIWSKPNPMPESVTDRCTKAHEYIFLLAKSAKYHCDMEAIKELADGDTHPRGTKRSPPIEHAGIGHKDWCRYMTRDALITSRNRRSVWTVTTKPYPPAHFATYPPELIEPCVKAGCPDKVCVKCGAPWTRLIETTRTFESGSGKSGAPVGGKNGPGLQGGGETGDIRLGPVVHTQPRGWKPGCRCDAGTLGGIVLDPFAGSGTTLQVALKHGCRAIGIELNRGYLPMIQTRIKPELDQGRLDFEPAGEPQRHGDTKPKQASLAFSAPPCLRGE